MKKIIAATLLLTLISFVGCTSDEKTDISQLKDIPLLCEMKEFDYSELNKEAGIIAKVEVLDDLTEENSFPEYVDIEGKPHLMSAIL